MRAKPSEKPLEFMQGMLGNYYKNPAFYAQNVGELNAILWAEHHTWAGLADRESEFIRVRCDIYNGRAARRIERVRAAPVTDSKSVKVVLDLWNKIDRKLKIDTRPEQYDQFIDSKYLPPYSQD